MHCCAGGKQATSPAVSILSTSPSWDLGENMRKEWDYKNERSSISINRNFKLEKEKEKNHLCMLGKQPPCPHGFCKGFAIHGAGAQVGGQSDGGEGGGGGGGRGRCLSAPVTRI